MSESVYKTIWGRAMYDADEREYNGGQVQSVSVRPLTYAGKDEKFSVRVTIWPELGIPTVQQGDLVFANGKYEQVEKGDKVYHNLSANEALVMSPKRAEKKGVVNKKTETAAAGSEEADLF